MSHLIAALLVAWPADVHDAPSHPPSIARIAPAGEPGTPLVIRGTVYAPDGVTPVAGVIVYGYHTDASGIYRTGNSRAQPPRLRGWARTDANGHFEFHAIRPAPYPGREVPAHVHFHVWGGGYPRQWTKDLLFRSNPLLRTDKLRHSSELGKFANICEPRECWFNIRLSEVGNFR